MIVPQYPAQDLTRLARVLAAELTRFFRQVALDHTRLRNPHVAVDKNWRFAHLVDLGTVGLAPRLSLEKVDEHRLPVEPVQVEGQGGLVGMAGFSKTMQLYGHGRVPSIAVIFSVVASDTQARDMLYIALVGQNRFAQTRSQSRKPDRLISGIMVMSLAGSNIMR